MTEINKLKLAIQRKGRLTDKSVELLKLCGLDIESYTERLVVTARNFPLEILFLRDDDIPEYVQDSVADAGIVGENVLFEKQTTTLEMEKLGFGRCSLIIAHPEKNHLKSINEIDGKTIATSYPNILKNFLKQNNINAKIIELSGSVEIAPSLGVADLICDIVSTGNTLMMNKLKKSFNVFDSEAVLISSKATLNNPEKNGILQDLLGRIRSVKNARDSKYLMMNIPKSSLERIVEIIPSLKSPTVLHLADENMLAVHAVIPSNKFWNIIEDLRAAGASGILLLPIENLIQ
ncbi:MAG: ATP phosphoribosyltransferase [Ignavibacteria bacterium]